MENQKEGKIVFSIYFYIYDNLVKNNREEITRNEMRYFLRGWNIPDWLKPVVIQEMQNLGLIKQVSKRTIKINKIKSPLFNSSKVYQAVGLWG